MFLSKKKRSAMQGSIRIYNEYTLMCDLIYNIYIHKNIEQLSKEIHAHMSICASQVAEC